MRKKKRIENHRKLIMWESREHVCYMLRERVLEQSGSDPNDRITEVYRGRLTLIRGLYTEIGRHSIFKYKNYLL